jgi:hypothetical protein
MVPFYEGFPFSLPRVIIDAQIAGTRKMRRDPLRTVLAHGRSLYK